MIAASEPQAREPGPIPGASTSHRGRTGPKPLKRLTAEALAPIWSRLDVPTTRIAERLGVSASGLVWKARALGLPPRPHAGARVCKCPPDLFRRMWLAGVWGSEIAQAFGYAGAESVSKRARDLGLPSRVRSKGREARVRGARGGWVGGMTLVEFRELEARRLMDEADAKGRARPWPV